MQYLYLGQGALLEHFSKGNIPFEIGHVRDMETNFSNGAFALFSYFLKFGHKVLTECRKSSCKPFV